ncbi:MAG: thiamine-monophosphate kinase [Acidobacteriota bacterium]|jgi:thiamine-monophosphate kinase|nr:thiamine-monophosphate kinase [Acidobacteriota bacterium]
MNQITSEQQAFEVIKSVLPDAVLDSHGGVLLGVSDGDDAAVVTLPAGDSLVIASDFVRGSGFYLFELNLINYYDVGYYLAVANISDMAAMGAKPLGLLTVIRYSKQMSIDDFRAALQGVKDACSLYQVAVVGGDTGGYHADVFSATAYGSVRGQPLCRSGATPGDRVCLVGEVGLPIAALAYFKVLRPKGMKVSDEEEQRLLLSWRRPQAQVLTGQILKMSGCVTACQDVSDGLLATLRQLGSASNVGWVVDEEKIPVADVVVRVAELAGVNPLRLAASASVDFSLLFTVSPSGVDSLRKELASHGLTLVELGDARSQTGTYMQRPGGLTLMDGVEWQQQTGDYLAEILK